MARVDFAGSRLGVIPRGGRGIGVEIFDQSHCVLRASFLNIWATLALMAGLWAVSRSATLELATPALIATLSAGYACSNTRADRVLDCYGSLTTTSARHPSEALGKLRRRPVTTAPHPCRRKQEE